MKFLKAAVVIGIAIAALFLT
jgi:hypothetical protein